MSLPKECRKCRKTDVAEIMECMKELSQDQAEGCFERHKKELRKSAGRIPDGREESRFPQLTGGIRHSSGPKRLSDER